MNFLRGLRATWIEKFFFALYNKSKYIYFHTRHYFQCLTQNIYNTSTKYT